VAAVLPKTGEIMLENLVAQREEIEKQIREIRAAEQADALERVRNLIRLHNISLNDVFERKNATKPAARKVAPKYRDPETGTTWTGRGRSPAWFDASRKHLFEIGG
jgi:DNA-binding protein H-NS